MGHSLSWFSWQQEFYWVGLSAPRPAPNQEDQASVFVTPGDRVTQLYPQALGTLLTTRMTYVGAILILRSPHGKGGSSQLAVNLNKVKEYNKMLKEIKLLSISTFISSKNGRHWVINVLELRPPWSKYRHGCIPFWPLAQVWKFIKMKRNIQ
jgi:hypothetical protein